jgi:ring-1,2-phenylacetyl-CoA epoxidase subunit PaaC
LFLSYAGEVEGNGRDEDALAYLRNDHEFRNLQLVEVKDRDFGTAVGKLLCLSTFQHLLYEKLTGSTDAQIAAIAGKCVKESAYHVDHAALWTIRLGAGTHESHRRMAAALEEIWPYTYELFASDDLVKRLGAVAVDPATLQPEWQDRVYGVLQAGELSVPQTTWRPVGGRDGRHTEALSYLLAEMQVLHRAHPGATW